MDNLITDEIIKRRLLIDGDGVGDDRKLIGLIKSYVAWASVAPSSSASKGPPAPTDRPLRSQLHQVEQSLRRTVEAIKVNQEARKMFVGLKVQVQDEIRETKDQIVDSKNLLEEATKHRKYSMEYDALAKLIQSKPDRKGTETRRVQLQNELHTLRSRQGSLDLKLEERKKNLAMMSSTIERLKELLGEADQEEMDCKSLEIQLAAVAAGVPTAQPLPSTSVTPTITTTLPPISAALNTPIKPVLLSNQQQQSSPMEVDIVAETPPGDNKSSSPSTSPTQQMSDEVSQSSESVSGVVTSVPLSPLPGKPKSEKYEDLSESEGEQA